MHTDIHKGFIMHIPESVFETVFYKWNQQHGGDHQLFGITLDLQIDISKVRVHTVTVHVHVIPDDSDLIFQVNGGLTGFIEGVFEDAGELIAVGYDAVAIATGNDWRAIEAGAMGYITKQSAPEQLVKAIRKVHSGHRYLTDEAIEALALRIAKGGGGQSPLDSLSMRELQVLRRLGMGHTNREIASAYNISIKTVDTYRARLLKKLDLRNNAELIRFAIQNNLIET
mgnify:CR=1 FL=1